MTIPNSRRREIVHRYRGEDGAAAVEAPLAFAGLLLLFAVVSYTGHISTARQGLESAAADAARAASIARTAATATLDAQQAAQADITNQHLDCTSLTVVVDTADFDKLPGQPGTVNVTVSCRLSLATLVFSHLPGSQVLTQTMSSPLDTWRQQ